MFYFRLHAFSVGRNIDECIKNICIYALAYRCLLLVTIAIKKNINLVPMNV